MSPPSEIRVRIAPSPSGFLHVGTARTSVYNWLFARHHHGKFILRIEDTDLERSDPKMVEAILEGLRWLGLSWDEEPYYQSKRFEVYPSYAEKLLKRGKAYHCYCSPELLKQKREEAIKEKRPVKYDRHCLHLSDEEKKRLKGQAVLRATRLKVAPGETQFKDVVYGDLSYDNADIEDFIIMRSDGRPTYNFACVVDDYEMRISHVIRGNDHIPNTYKQLLLYEALGITPPQFAHLPLSLGIDRSKISKRDGAVAITDYRQMGFLPEAVVNFLALLGWSPGDDREVMSTSELIETFSLERVSQSNPVFDIEKLKWMNGEHIRSKGDNELVPAVAPFLIEASLTTKLGVEIRWEYMKKVVGLLKERCRLLTDFAALGRYFFTDKFDYNPDGAKKHFFSPDIDRHLATLAERYSSLQKFDLEAIESGLRNLAEELGISAAKLIHPTRLATTGMTKGPSLFEILEVLGQEEVVKRLRRALEFIRGNPGLADRTDSG
ncbi:MAG: glutamyl-tRNA synthetase [candidate division Zixibacteria bacterium DG_27]|nr:MAG: glutamyl-tRNA synthetase [candidate division Zixibacteria bacterium DG_27]